MGKLTATMVVDITDRTGTKTQAIIGNLDRLKRAERDRMLAERGVSISRVQRAQERELIEQAAAQKLREDAMMEASRKRSAAMATFAARGAAAAGVAAYAAARTYGNYADIEDRVAGIAVNADKGLEAVQPTMQKLRVVAQDTKQSFDTVMSGLDTLVAGGRSLEESLSFLPSVSLTAKASRSYIADIASTADAVGASFDIAGGQMQQAFDMMVTGGKLGKFELKDMAQFMPRLAPAFAALGYKGTEGLGKLVAMLQTVRMQAGSSGEAATYLENVLNKMYSEDTAKRFDKFGVDLPKALNKARKEGKDVLEVFLDMTQLALKGDLTNITRLFGDAEMQKGVRALIMLREEQAKLNAEINNAKGSALADFNAQVDLSKNKIQELSNNWDAFMANVGSGVATVVNPVLAKINKGLSENQAADKALEGLDVEQREWQMQDFAKRFMEANPNANFEVLDKAYRDALIKVGRGEAKTVLDDLDLDEARRKGGEQTSQYPSRGKYDPALVQSGSDDRPLGRSAGAIPVPTSRPGKDRAGGVLERLLYDTDRTQRTYPSRGKYDPDVVDQEKELALRQKMRGIIGRPALGAEAGDDEAVSRQQLEAPTSGRQSVPSEGSEPQTPTAPASRQQAVPVEGGTLQNQTATNSGRQSVSIEGTPSVTITNPPPRPNVSISAPMSITINEAQNAHGVAQQIGKWIQDELNGLQTSTNDSGL